jgi:hypothetical protein
MGHLNPYRQHRNIHHVAEPSPPIGAGAGKPMFVGFIDGFRNICNRDYFPHFGLFHQPVADLQHILVLFWEGWEALWDGEVRTQLRPS